MLKDADRNVIKKESTKLRNYKRQPYCALNTNCGKC